MKRNVATWSPVKLVVVLLAVMLACSSGASRHAAPELTATATSADTGSCPLNTIYASADTSGDYTNGSLTFSQPNSVVIPSAVTGLRYVGQEGILYFYQGSSGYLMCSYVTGQKADCGTGWSAGMSVPNVTSVTLAADTTRYTVRASENLCFLTCSGRPLKTKGSHHGSVQWARDQGGAPRRAALEGQLS